MTESFVMSKGQAYWFQFDECDRDLINSYSWNISEWGYIQCCKYICVRNSKNINEAVILHRKIAERLGMDLNKQIDHINGNKLDNRRCNLREATHQQNNFNKPRLKRNTPGFKGVSYRKDIDKYRAYISVNYKQISLGCFDTPEEAHQAYCNAAKKYHGEFANFG